MIDKVFPSSKVPKRSKLRKDQKTKSSKKELWLPMSSVARFAENPPLKQIFKILGNIFNVIWFWAKFLTYFGTICMLFANFIAVKGQILKKQSGHLVTPPMRLLWPILKAL